MLIFVSLLAVLAVLAVLYLLWLRGRTSHPLCAQLDGWLYAHRGYHTEPEAPENSCAAFRRAVAQGFGAELDVHLLADGGLAVLHDSTLQRMTGKPGVVEDLTTAQLAEYTLGQSGECIPTFGQVLEIFGGKTPLIIELKTYQGNAAALCAAVCAALEGYPGTYCLESFDPRALIWLKKNRPDLVRGQLACNFLAREQRSGLALPTAFAATFLLGNLLAKPDFIAYRFADRGNLSNRICRDIWHLAGASWTLHSQEELYAAQREGLWPIFEGFAPEISAGEDEA